MTVFIFLIVLVALILVHEAGHFVAAKWSGMRVDEFGIGFPPRLYAKKLRETEYSINLVPFGGFVRIYGENGGTGTDTEGRAFTDKSKWKQALVLVAGVVMNVIFAWVLLSASLVAGVPRGLSADELAQAPDAALAISTVLAGSPAEKAGVVAGDRILSAATDAGSFSTADAEGFTTFIADTIPGNAVALTVRHSDGTKETVFATPELHVAPSHPERLALGVSISAVGTVPVAWYAAPLIGAEATWHLTKDTTLGLLAFFGSVITFSADFSAVAGPIGIAGAVGDASAQGFFALLTLAAVISINLAVINLLPLPALDGGRLVFVAIEGIFRRTVRPVVMQGINLAGFAFLILLMVAVTFSDIVKLFAA